MGTLQMKRDGQEREQERKYVRYGKKKNKDEGMKERQLLDRG